MRLICGLYIYQSCKFTKYIHNLIKHPKPKLFPTLGNPAAAAAALAAMDPEEVLLAEMAGIQEGIQAREKRERKKRRELKIKARVRAAQMAQSEGVLMDEQQVCGVRHIGFDKGSQKAVREGFGYNLLYLVLMKSLLEQLTGNAVWSD